MVHLEWTVDFLLNFGTLVLSTDSPPPKKKNHGILENQYQWKIQTYTNLQIL